MMNKYILVLLLMFSISCGDEFLEYSPQGVQNADSFEPFSAVIACYNDLADFDQRQSIWANYFLADIVGDNSWKGGRSQNDQVELLQLSNFTAVPSNDQIDDTWGAFYSRIFRFNWTIEGLQKSEDLDEDEKNRYLGEVKFLRGMHYFWLNQMFNGVPLVLKPLNFEEANLSRATAAEVYAQIEKDLSFAVDHLPKLSDMNLKTELGRATQGAAQAFLAKVYMYQKKWTEAEATAKALIESDEYALYPEYGLIFTFEGEFSSESVFEINFVETVEATNGTLHGRAQRSPNGFRGWGFNAPTMDLVEAFEPGDPRLIHTILFEGDKAFDVNGKLRTLDHSGYFNPDKMHSRKGFIPGTLFPSSNSNLNENVRLMRYAEVLLIYAEAANENGKPEEAKKYLNMVRERARNSSLEDPYRELISYELEPPAEVLPDITTTDKIELREAIWHERRVELALEGDRFYDLVRQGRAGEILRAFAAKYDTDKGKNFKDGTHEYFPIPQVEVDASLGKIVQNPGY